MTWASYLRRARFYAIVDASYVASARWETVAAALLDGGADILQVRAKGLPMAEVEARVEAVAPLCAAAGVPLVINDYLALAAATPGAGLHLGQDDEPRPAAARATLGSGRLFGYSTHSLAQAQAAIAQARIFDYFAVGPVFATPTKADYTAVGLELVSAVARLRPPLPWFAIGGINRRTIAAVCAAGAERVVVVSDALQASDPTAVVAEIRAHLSAPLQRCA